MTTEYKHPSTGEPVEASVFFEILKQTATQSKADHAEQEALLKEAKDNLNAKIEAITKAWEAQNAELIQTEATAKVMADLDDGTIREGAIKYFIETVEEGTGVKFDSKDAKDQALIEKFIKDNSSKQIGHGISIRVASEMSFEDADAVKYAIDHDMSHLLKVDTTKFKKFASVTPLEFVSTEPKVSAVVSYKDSE